MNCSCSIMVLVHFSNITSLFPTSLGSLSHGAHSSNRKKEKPMQNFHLLIGGIISKLIVVLITSHINSMPLRLT